MSDSPLSLALRLRWKTGHTGCVVGSDPVSLLHTTESDHRVPDRYEVDEQVRRLLAREQALAEVAEIKAAAQAEEWFGISGDVFDPDTPEPHAVRAGVRARTVRVRTGCYLPVRPAQHAEDLARIRSRCPGGEAGQPR